VVRAMVRSEPIGTETAIPPQTSPGRTPRSVWHFRHSCFSSRGAMYRRRGVPLSHSTENVSRAPVSKVRRAAVSQASGALAGLASRKAVSFPR